MFSLLCYKVTTRTSVCEWNKCLPGLAPLRFFGGSLLVRLDSNDATATPIEALVSFPYASAELNIASLQSCPNAVDIGTVWGRWDHVMICNASNSPQPFASSDSPAPSLTPDINISRRAVLKNAPYNWHFKQSASMNTGRLGRWNWGSVVLWRAALYRCVSWCVLLIEAGWLAGWLIRLLRNATLTADWTDGSKASAWRQKKLSRVDFSAYRFQRDGIQLHRWIY